MWESMAKVLIVDDQPAIRDLLNRVVTGAGHEALIATNAEEALAFLDQKPEILFADIDMPDQTGVELVFKIRQHPDLAELPVVFVTAYRERVAAV